MKIERLKLNPKQAKQSYYGALRNLKPGEMIRLTTAQEWRNMNGILSKAKQGLKVAFKSANDGDSDVLIFIKESPKKV